MWWQTNLKILRDRLERFEEHNRLLEDRVSRLEHRLCRLGAIEGKIDQLIGLSRETLKEGRHLDEVIARLTADVDTQSTVIASNNQLLANLAAEVRATAGNTAAANALADKIEANTKSINDAVVANTPAAPTPPDPTPTP